MQHFFHVKYPYMRVHIDDTCALPHDWNRTWWNTTQWGDLGQVHWRKKYAAAGFIPHMVANSPFYEKDWRRANLSLVVLFARHYSGGVCTLQQQCLQRLRSDSEAFRHANGKNHFFIFTDSRGACSLDGKFKDVEFTKHHVIGQHGEIFKDSHYFFRRGKGPHIRCYDKDRDVNIPTPNIHTFPSNSSYEFANQYNNPVSKTFLLFYAGWNYDTRMKLVNYFQNDPDLVVRRSIPSNKYQFHMSRAKFCPVCGGFSQWTPRLMEAIYFGCVPIILSDEWELPFSDVVDWTKFSIRVLRQNYKNIKKIASHAPYQILHQNLMLVRPIFRYHLHAFTNNDMLPILLYQMSRRLSWTPHSSDIHPISNSVSSRTDYDLHKPQKGKKAHSVKNIYSTFIANSELWNCSTKDGYFADCKKMKLESRENLYLPAVMPPPPPSNEVVFELCVNASEWPSYNFSCKSLDSLSKHVKWRLRGEPTVHCWSDIYEGLVNCNDQN